MRMGGLEPEQIEQVVSKKGKKVDSEATMIRAQTAAQKEQRLAHGLKAPVSNSAPSEPIEPPKDRSKLLDKVQAYKEKFPHLKSRNKLTGKSSAEEIEDELHAVLGGAETEHLRLQDLKGLETGGKLLMMEEQLQGDDDLASPQTQYKSDLGPSRHLSRSAMTRTRLNFGEFGLGSTDIYPGYGLM